MPRPWKKILYENQGYPDNYTDKTMFLKDLRTQVKYVTLNEAFMGATILLEEFCTVTAFVLVYVFLINELVVPEFVLTSSSCLTTTGFLLYRLCYTETLILRKFSEDFKTVLIFLVFGYLFSPILHTLTDTISTDTIYTMTFFMLLVHLIFFDYGVGAAIVSNSLSVSAAIFASICLASRLPSAYHAFILMSVAVQFFVLFPLLRRKLNRSLLISTVLTLFNLYLLLLVSKLFFVIFVLTVGFINVFCLFLFVNYQKYKMNIYGPWDEAIVDDADSVLHKL